MNGIQNQNHRLAFLLWGSFVALLAAGIFFSSCGRQPRTVHPAFYYWQTTLALSGDQQDYLDSLNCKTLYIKILDLGTDEVTGAVLPLSKLEVRDTAGLSDRRIVPCIFIANRVFQNTSPERIEDLAITTANFCRRIGEKLPMRTDSMLIQFDCDWTPGTRSLFFDFLKKVKQNLPATVRLGATIRLHQYKFPDQTGVPPVDRGMLMLYNTGDIEDWQTGNSIFSTDAARKYIEGAPRHYPLPLDVALPVFAWSLVYRNGDLWKIIPSLGESQLADSIFFTPQTGNAWLVKKETLREGHYLRTGDWIRRESISSELLQDAGRWAGRLDLAGNPDVAFFHLDSVVQRRYPANLLNSICRQMQ